ncbi:hypothetical protein [Rufibacter ruber]|uniref:hypothetical protein n=1 Tax=Rufibacter ruber TaxID=1783499 RepID=UPI00083389D9|nr:hypothetical protein [Rufibacter ruber]
MKAVKMVLAFCLLLGAGAAQAQTPPAGLTEFLARFKAFEDRHHQRQAKQVPMPTYTPDSSRSAMPLPNALKKWQSYSVDIATGLRYYLQLGKVFDPETGYSLPYNPELEYLVDVEKGKIYLNGRELKPQRPRNTIFEKV